MPHFLTIEALWNYLSAIPNFSQHGKTAYQPGLEAITSFCEVIGNPHHQFATIHVAGTNGKGTVCAMLSSCLIKNDYKTGLYTSPHLIRLNERIKINGLEIEDEALLDFYNTYFDLISSFQLSYFEQLTACAFWYFAKQQVQIAVIETGLGGRLDATNIIQPECSVITSIGLDHTDILGNTLESIAFEKAGIIKKNIPVVTGTLLPVAQNVISQQADLKKCSIHIIGKNDAEVIDLQTELPGQINVINANICIQTLNLIREKWPTSFERNELALKQFAKISGFIGRTERLLPENHWYFDGAHNVEAAENLIKTLQTLAPATDWIVLCSFMHDKLSPDLVKVYEKCKKIYFFPINSQRAATFDEISLYFSDIISVEESHIPSLLASLKNEKVLFTGSFYFYTIVKDWINRYKADT